MLTNSKEAAGPGSAATESDRRGPLHGIRVLEIEGMGPGPFAAMMLADLGANVLVVRRPEGAGRKPNAVLERNRAGIVTIDMKNAFDKARLMDLIGRADVLIEGFRPGVMERLGLGPAECHASNPRLVYGRVTGWGQSGPMAQQAGHDINYIALTGALHAIGTAESGPVPPLNLVGDYGGGGALLVIGILSALLEAKTSGRGQVVDAAMIDGSSLLMATLYGLRANGRWPAERAGNVLDGSAYYYRCYACADDQWFSVGAIEPPFRRELLEKLGLGDDADAIMCGADNDPGVHERIAAIFRTRSRDEWDAVFAGSNACVAPVLAMSEVLTHPQVTARGTFAEIDGVVHPMPAPRFSRTPAAAPNTANATSALVSEWGL